MRAKVGGESDRNLDPETEIDMATGMSNAATCQHCKSPIDWGALCEACVDREKERILRAPPDARRCRYCGAFKDAPGHVELFCKREAGDA